MRLHGNFEVDAPRPLVWERITDPGLMAICIPGCESIERLDDRSYQAVVAVGVGAVRARFNLLIEVIEENSPIEVRSRTTGMEGSRASSLNAESRVWLTQPDPGRTGVHYESEVNITGRLGKFGMGVMRKHIEKMGGQFAEKFEQGILDNKSPADRNIGQTAKTAPRRGFLQRLGLGRAADEDQSEHDRAERPQFDGRTGSNAPVKGVLLYPASIAEAVDILENEPGSFPLAGGATLIAMRNAGLVDVKRYVSLERLDGLHGISAQPDGSIRIGAMTRHRETAGSEVLSGTLSVLRQAAGSIASMPVRNMGTMGGSLAHADPAADYLAALACIDASVEIAGPQGTRTIGIGDLIVDWYETSLERGEIITAILLPPPQPGHSRYRKVARVSGDYAVASCAMSVATGGQRRIHIAVGGCGPFPIRHADAELSLNGRPLSRGDVDAFADQLLVRADPVDDVRGSADYRRALIPRLVRDAVAGLEGARAG